VDRESGETVAIKKMSITLPGEANAKEGVRRLGLGGCCCPLRWCAGAGGGGWHRDGGRGPCLVREGVASHQSPMVHPPR
jgi:hypothetical protein